MPAGQLETQDRVNELEYLPALHTVTHFLTLDTISEKLAGLEGQVSTQLLELSSA